MVSRLAAPAGCCSKILAGQAGACYYLLEHNFNSVTSAVQIAADLVFQLLHYKDLQFIISTYFFTAYYEINKTFSVFPKENDMNIEQCISHLSLNCPHTSCSSSVYFLSVGSHNLNLKEYATSTVNHTYKFDGKHRK
jgi:hypothetical protein